MAGRRRSLTLFLAFFAILASQLSNLTGGAIPIPVDSSKPLPMLQMPKWGTQLNAEEIDAVVEYLWSLAPKKAAGAAAKDDF